jgi:hypothetical protein
MICAAVSQRRMSADPPASRTRVPRAERSVLQLSEAKLMLPRAQPGIVRRPRLLRSLDRDRAAALTLVDAPVGYGKTMLLRSWCAEQSRPVAWITLDAADEDRCARTRTRCACGHMWLAPLTGSGKASDGRRLRAWLPRARLSSWQSIGC